MFASPATAHDLDHNSKIQLAQNRLNGPAPYDANLSRDRVDHEREFHLGTIKTKPSNADAAKNTGPQKTKKRRRVAKTPDELLAQARKALDTQRLKRARRRLELLVARFPDSPQADAARTHLARIYARKKPLSTDTTTGTLGTRKSVALDSQGPAARAHAQLAARAAIVIDETKPIPPVNTTMSRRLSFAVGDRVFFAPNSDILGEKARHVLRDQSRWLKLRKSYFVLVTGHADDPGNLQLNMDLSVRRAKAVREYLIKAGIPAHRIGVRALGRKQQVASCAEPICSAQNRRTVTLILQSPPVKINANTMSQSQTR